jgi:hypothetical protein
MKTTAVCLAKLYRATSLVLNGNGTVHSEANHCTYCEEQWRSGTVPTDHRFTGRRNDATMKKAAKARVKWLSAEQGGRTAPPQGEKYSTVVHFQDDVEDWPQVAWSLVVGLSEAESTEESLEIIAPVWFLFCDRPGAPNHLLRPNSRFRLLEGYRVVAEGEILD